LVVWHSSIVDRYPSWLPDANTAVFQSNRPRPGRPSWCIQLDGVFLVGADGGGLRALDVGLHGPAWWPAVSSDGSRLVYLGPRGRMQAVDLRTGMAGILNPEERPGGQACWSPDSSRIVFSALRRHGDVDIFETEIKEEDGRIMTGRQDRIVRRDGADYAPVFSLDGEWVYFGGQPVDPDPDDDEVPPTSLYRVRAHLRYHENDEPTLVAGPFGSVGRASWFLDGQRLLLSCADGLHVVNVGDRSVAPLDLPELRDPDLPQGEPLALRDAVLSPDGGKLAFSARRWSGHHEDPAATCVYTCKLDGSDLKRLTPPHEVVVPVYEFPETGLSALDLPWEDLRNRPRPTFPVEGWEERNEDG
jgi:hypothetical protein